MRISEWRAGSRPALRLRRAFRRPQWHEVLSELGTTSHSDMPSYVTRDGDTCRRAAEEVATPLIVLAARIIAEARGTA